MGSRDLGEIASLLRVDWALVLTSLRVGGSDGAPMEPLASTQPRPYCVVKSHILLKVTLFSQNSMDLDWEVEKHPWWRALEYHLMAWG